MANAVISEAIQVYFKRASQKIWTGMTHEVTQDNCCNHCKRRFCCLVMEDGRGNPPKLGTNKAACSSGSILRSPAQAIYVIWSYKIGNYSGKEFPRKNTQSEIQSCDIGCTMVNEQWLSLMIVKTLELLHRYSQW